MKPRALLSVTDKTGLVEFARGLRERGFEILSTGGTARALREAGLAVTDVSDVTGFPEIMDGRVKTLHPHVHGALLGDVQNPAHVAAMAEHGIEPIQVIAVNLYAFEQTVAKPHELSDAVESIDIGGPAMIRAAAKNAANVWVVVDPDDYGAVLRALGGDEKATNRQKLMAKAFRHTAYYDSVIAQYLSDRFEEDPLPETLTVGLRRSTTLRYGENPQQPAALYTNATHKAGIARAKVIWGKELSYNNLLDADAAWELVADLPATSCAIIKHGNPCGAAVAGSFAEAYRIARASDPISAFGGIAAFNGQVDEAAAEAMAEKGNFLEVVVGTSFTPGAREVFASRSGWGQTVRVLEAELPGEGLDWTIRTIRGGALVQSTDECPHLDFEVVSERQPTETEWSAIRLQWAIVKHVKSNAIVVGNEHQLLGIGTGQMNRVQSVRLAIEGAGDQIGECVLASDAFFPFPDSIHTAADAGIRAIVQPGGSKKDADVIAAANERGISLVFTGVRHFRH